MRVNNGMQNFQYITCIHIYLQNERLSSLIMLEC